jgi:hypothetical protein
MAPAHANLWLRERSEAPVLSRSCWSIADLGWATDLRARKCCGSRNLLTAARATDRLKTAGRARHGLVRPGHAPAVICDSFRPQAVWDICSHRGEDRDRGAGRAWRRDRLEPPVARDRDLDIELGNEPTPHVRLGQRSRHPFAGRRRRDCGRRHDRWMTNVGPRSDAGGRRHARGDTHQHRERRDGSAGHRRNRRRSLAPLDSRRTADEAVGSARPRFDRAALRRCVLQVYLIGLYLVCWRDDQSHRD